VKAYRKKLAKEPLPQDMAAQERIRELERRNRELEMENAFLKKSGFVLREGAAVTEKYSFIAAEYDQSPGENLGGAPTVVQMCEWLGVSTSGYHDWRSRPQSAAAKRRELLKIKIKALFEANNEEYGCRRMHAALVRGGEQCSPELVRGLMRGAGPGALPAEAVAPLPMAAQNPTRSARQATVGRPGEGIWPRYN
jgi:putative transposase